MQLRDQLGQGIRIGDGLAAPTERLQVGLHGHAVELDGLLDRLGGDRQGSRLEGGAHHEHVGRLRGAEQGLGELARVQVHAARRGTVDRVLDVRGGRVVNRGVDDHGPGGDLRRGNHRGGALGVGDLEVGAVRADQAVTTEVEVAVAGADLRWLLQRGARDPDIRDHGAALLGQAGHVEGAGRVPVEHGGGGQDGRDRHDAGAADAGQAQREAAIGVDCGLCRCGE